MSRTHGLDDDARLRTAMAAVHDLAAAGGRYPHLTSWGAYPSGPSADEQFDLGLGFLLDGISGRLAGRLQAGDAAARPGGGKLPG